MLQFLTSGPLLSLPAVRLIDSKPVRQQGNLGVVCLFCPILSYKKQFVSLLKIYRNHWGVRLTITSCEGFVFKKKRTARNQPGFLKKHLSGLKL